MKNKLLYTFEQDLEGRLKNPTFNKAWQKSEPEFQLARKIIEKRLERKMSQRELARKAKTTQAVISRIETMQANPSLKTIVRIADVLGTNFSFSFS